MMKFILLACSVFLIGIGSFALTPTKGKNVYTSDVILSRGFLTEQYKIDTHGAVLVLHRIINPLANPKTLNKYPVLYGHGVLYDSHSMISRSENSRPRKPVLGQPTIKEATSLDPSDDRSLPFMFSNNNFDVWLYDAPGTGPETKNDSILIDMNKADKFWDFSLDDEALIDLPKLIDFVLTKTQSEKVIYVGFSESTFFMFALLSAMPHWSDKIAAFVALAPVAYVSHIRGITVPTFAAVAALTPDDLHYSVVPQPIIDGADLALRSICLPGISQVVCKPISDSIGGAGVGEGASDFFANFFKTTSLKAVKQFLQLYMRKRFAMYDYGAVKNMKVYGQISPPVYNLGRIRSENIILARGFSDFLSTVEDQGRLLVEMGKKPFMDIVVPSYNHFDFLDGIDLVRLVNGPIMRGVYQLLYKDGPNIFKSFLSSSTSQIRPSTGSAAAVASSRADIPRSIGVLPNINVNLGLLKLPTDLIQSVTGSNNILENIHRLTANG